MKHDDWWIKNGGSIGSCGYAASKRSWQAALKHGTRSTDAQQLKAEIAALASEIENDISTGAKPYNHSRIVTILRQLSAV